MLFSSLSLIGLAFYFGRWAIRDTSRVAVALDKVVPTGPQKGPALRIWNGDCYVAGVIVLASAAGFIAGRIL